MKETPVTTERRPFESKFYFGDKVKVILSNRAEPIECSVFGINFTNDEVWYDVVTPNGQVLKDIDSAYCE